MIRRNYIDLSSAALLKLFFIGLIIVKLAISGSITTTLLIMLAIGTCIIEFMEMS
jgi:hypothetical protein